MRALLIPLRFRVATAVALLASSAAATDLIAWSSRSSMPQAGLSLLAGETLNDNFWVAGGSFTVDRADFESYDPTTRRWTVRAPMASARRGCALVALNGSLYAIGGRSGTTYLASVERYDLATGVWISCSAMTTARYGVAAAAVGGTIYAVGGANDSAGSLDTMEAYDPATMSWTVLPYPIPTPRYSAKAVALNGLVYVIGGWNDTSEYLSQVEAYDPVAHVWSAKAALSKRKQWVGAATLGGLIYVTGGGSNFGGYQTQVESYDPGADRWTIRDPMATARAGHAMGAIGRVLFVAGGHNDDYTMNFVEGGTVVTLDARPPKTGSLQVRNNVIYTGSGTIAYVVARGAPSGGTVRLTLYDVAGRPVADLGAVTLDASGFGYAQFDAWVGFRPLLAGMYWVVATGAVQDKKQVMVVTYAADIQ
ncbi:MAG: kelch repeat-containing protein [Candidatus Coatesbacteria bacterium]